MPKKILLADDSITIQKVVELTFSDGDYEVTAVNNGAKAVQKLAEMRPDIILSDIIMPEKNGYEVCEYVKSHPEFRNIPVVLLTGTFEPFDPDRAEKAGCDAVVTKPFESQSLIHKVEELIAQSQSGGFASAPAASAPPPPPPAEAPSPWMDDTAVTSEPGIPFSTAGGSGFPIPAPEPFTHDNDIFAAPAPPDATTEMPFEIPPTPLGSDTPFGEEPASDAFGGETRAFPRMTFEQMQEMAATPPPPPPPAPEPSPWDEPAQFSGETRAFDKISFDDFPPPVAAAPEPEAESPFGAPPPPEEFSNETRAFTRMSIEEMRQMAAAEAAPAAAPEPEPIAEEPAPVEPSPWDQPEAPAFGGETRAFPKLSFDDFSEQPAPVADTPATPAWEPPAFSSEPASPFGEDAEAPAFGGETRAFQKLNFDDFQQMSAPAPDPQPEPQVEASAWDAAPEDAPVAEPIDETPAASPFEDDAASPFAAQPAAFEAAPIVDDEEPVVPGGLSDEPQLEDLPFSTEPTVEPDLPAAAEEPSWSLMAGASEAAEAEAEPEEPAVAPAPAALAPEAPPLAIAARASEASDLSDEQIERIARRVVELISDQVVRNIAWEVIPDLAEMVVKERIRQLEAEA
jgi:CheY-like chemotaxis protein